VKYTADGADSISGATGSDGTYTLTADTMRVAGLVTKLQCRGDSLSWINVSDNAALETLDCCDNAIAGKNMDALISSLPDRKYKTAGTLIAVDTAGDNNACTVVQVAAALARNWKVLAADGSPYQGTAGGINTVTLVTSRQAGKMIYLEIGSNGAYSLKGATQMVIMGDVVPDCRLTSDTVTITGDITSLDCKGDELTSLDLGNDTSLNKLNCNDNRLTALDLSSCAKLTELHCNGDSLTALDLSRNTALKSLECDSNRIDSLDLSHNKALTSVSCKNNRITALGLSGCAALTWVDCSNNSLSSLDLSHNKALSHFVCSNNRLATLDVSRNTALYGLYCGGNSLTALDVSRNTALGTLNCTDNRLTALDLSHNTELGGLYCYGNSIRYTQMQKLVNSLFDWSGKSGLYILRAVRPGNDNNVISAEQVKIARAKNWRVMTDGSNDYEGAVGKITMVTSTPAGGSFWLRFRSAGSYTLSGATGTYSADGSSYKLTSDTVTITGDITLLDCDGNSLTALDVSKDFILSYLDCGNNSLNTLDVSQNDNLDTLFCFDNTFTTLDVSQNTNLAYLDCRDNSLDSLDCSGREALRRLTCSNCKLTSLKATDDANLAKLECDHNSLTALDVSRDTSLVLVDCRNNSIRDALMDTLVNTLVNRTGKAAGMFVVIDTDGDNNVCTATQVDVARAKNWNVKSADGNDYGGSPRTGIEGITGDPNVTVVGIYDLRGIRLARLQPGFNIIKLSNGTAKKVFIKE
jgi:hypothetical protein